MPGRGGRGESGEGGEEGETGSGGRVVDGPTLSKETGMRKRGGTGQRGVGTEGESTAAPRPRAGSKDGARASRAHKLVCRPTTGRRGSRLAEEGRPRL